MCLPRELGMVRFIFLAAAMANVAATAGRLPPNVADSSPSTAAGIGGIQGRLVTVEQFGMSQCPMTSSWTTDFFNHCLQRSGSTVSSSGISSMVKYINFTLNMVASDDSHQPLCYFFGGYWWGAPTPRTSSVSSRVRVSSTAPSNLCQVMLTGSDSDDSSH